MAGDRAWWPTARHHRLRAALVDRIDEVTELVCNETGRVEMDALAVELTYTLEAMRYWGRNARRFLRERSVGLGLFKLKRGRVRYEPCPVVAIRKFCYSQTLFSDRLGLGREPFWYPYQARGPAIAKRLLRVWYTPGLRARLLRCFGDGRSPRRREPRRTRRRLA